MGQTAKQEVPLYAQFGLSDDEYEIALRIMEREPNYVRTWYYRRNVF